MPTPVGIKADKVLLYMRLLLAPVGIKAAANKVLLYMHLFFYTLASIIDLIYGAMFQSILGYGQNKMLVTVLRTICKAVQFIDYWVIRRAICVVLQIMSDFFKFMYNLIVQISDVNIVGIKPFGWLQVTIG